jgi:streptogramin lyase
MVFNSGPSGGGTSKNNRKVELTSGSVKQFFMDSSTTTLNKKVQLSGSISSSQLTDIEAPQFIFENVAIPSPANYPDGVGVDSNNCIWNTIESTGSIYQLNQAGSVVTKFSSPGSEPKGLDVDAYGCIWNADKDFGFESIYRLDQTGNVETGFPSPSDRPSGLGVNNSTGCLWVADQGTDSIYRLNQSGNVDTGFSSPSSVPAGIGVDSNGCLWHGDENIFKLNQSGSVAAQYSVPFTPIGIGVAPNDSFWSSALSAHSIYLLNQQGQQESFISSPCVYPSRFASPATQPIGLGVDSNDCIWNSDKDAESIYQLDRNGNTISKIPSPSDFPFGVGLDSNDCIWNVDEYQSSIYRLDQNGTVEVGFEFSGNYPYGLDVDSSDSIWVTHIGYPDQCIYKLDQNGTVLSQFVVPYSGDNNSPTGLGVDKSDDCLWVANETQNNIYELNHSGSITTEFSAGGAPYGTGVDSQGCIFNAERFNASIYRFDQQGNNVSEYKLESKVSSRTGSVLELSESFKGYNGYLKIIDGNVSKARVEFYSQPDDGGSIGGGPGGG